MLSGFIAGSIATPALFSIGNVKNPVTILVSGITVAALYVAIWLAVSVLLSRTIKARNSVTAVRIAPCFFAGILPVFTYLPYLLYRTSRQGDSATLPPLSEQYSMIALLIWSALLLAVLLRVAAGRDESPLLNWIDSHIPLVLGASMAAWVAVMFPLDVLKVHYMHVNSINSALFKEAMLNVFDERAFMYSNLLFTNGASIFGVHMNVIFLLILPVFRLWPDYRMLMLISDVALALSAWPAYLIARRHFSQSISLLLALMVILHPIIMAQPGRSDFSEIRFVPVLFLTAFYLFEKRRFWGFTVFAVLLMTVREDFGLFVFFFAIYGVIRRMSLKWIAVPAMMGLGWFAISILYALPALSTVDSAVRVGVRYSSLGDTGGEILKTVLFRPWKLFQVAVSTPSHLGSIYGLFITTGFGIPFLSGAMVLAVPALAENLLQERTTFSNFMATPAVPTLFVAYVYGLNRLSRFIKQRTSSDPNRLTAIIILVSFFVAGSAFHVWFNPGLYQPRYNFEEARQAFDKVPDDGGVLMPEFMLAHAKETQSVRGYNQISYEKLFYDGFNITDDYVIVDQRIPKRLTRGEIDRYYEGMEEVSVLLAGSSEFSKVFDQNEITLYVRKDFPVENGP